MVVLIVDDDADDAQVLADVLHDILPGMDIRFATNAAECFEQLLQMITGPDFIFLDGKLPGMSSRDCLDRLEKQQRLNATRVVIYSGFSKEEIERQFGDKYLFVHKTGLMSELKSELMRLLQPHAI